MSTGNNNHIPEVDVLMTFNKSARLVSFTCFSETVLYMNRKIPRNLPHSLTMPEKEDSFAPPSNILPKAYATDCLKLRRDKTSVSQIPVEKS